MTHGVPVGYTWLGHRPEPFIHERARGCPLTGWGPCQAEFDGDRGRAIRHEERAVVVTRLRPDASEPIRGALAWLT